jgi:hypothetical protein
MVFKCVCGERYPVADEAAPVSIRCHRCGRILVRTSRSVRPPAVARRFQRYVKVLPYAGLAALAIAVLMGLLNLVDAEAGDSPAHPAVAMRTEAVLSDAADGAQGRGVLKVINESGKTIALRLIGPAYGDSRTILIPLWQDRRVLGLPPGSWKVRYCTGSGWQPDARRFIRPGGCAEFDESIQYSETIADETLWYSAAVMRFGPTPRESPAAHRISAEEFTAD